MSKNDPLNAAEQAREKAFQFMTGLIESIKNYLDYKESDEKDRAAANKVKKNG